MGPHRADIRTPAGWVLEFQHSSISADEITEREAFYGQMVWIVDASPFMRNLTLAFCREQPRLEWKYARRCWSRAEKHLYLDLHDGTLLRVRRMPNSGDDPVDVGVVPVSELVTRAGGTVVVPGSERITGYCETCKRNLVMTSWWLDPEARQYRRQCRRCNRVDWVQKYPVPEYVMWRSRMAKDRERALTARTPLGPSD